jgi:hypothetical protein
MKLNRKQTIIGAAALIALAGGSYGAYTYISGLPKRLNKEEAAKRYLEIVCPANAVNAEVDPVLARIKTINEEQQQIRTRTYYGQEALDQAQSRYDTLNNEGASQIKKYKALMTNRISLFKKEAQMFTDPKFIWPGNVRDDIQRAAEARMEHASDISEALKGSTGSDGDSDGKIFSAIRLGLGLEERGTGCPKKSGK